MYFAAVDSCKPEERAVHVDAQLEAVRDGSQGDRLLAEPFGRWGVGYGYCA